MKSEKRMSIIRHLLEFRKMLMISAYAIAVGVIIGWFIYVPLFKFLTHPVVGLEPVKFVTTSITEPITVKLKVSLMAGILIALPVVAWQVWSFIFPALKKKERKFFYSLVPFSTILFLAGAVFAFYVVLPIAIRFLLLINSGVQYQPLVSQSSYLNLLLKLLLSFGLGFELPVVVLIAVWLKILTPQWLAKKRKYALLLIVILVFIISPTPDIPSQLLMAAPFYLLYEVSIWMSYLIVRNRQKVLKTSLEG